MKNIFGLILLFAGLAIIAEAQIAGGGNYTLDKAVIAGGGGTSTNGQITVEGTSGQAIAGTSSTAPGLSVRSGFWAVQPLAPTAASVSLSGRVTNASGNGISNVYVTLTQADGTIRTARTASFGYFKFDEVLTGQIVIINVQAKRFTFAQPTLILNVADNLTELNFVADE
jgi:hypothetical protein